MVSAGIRQDGRSESETGHNVHKKFFLGQDVKGSHKTWTKLKNLADQAALLSVIKVCRCLQVVTAAPPWMTCVPKPSQLHCTE